MIDPDVVPRPDGRSGHAAVPAAGPLLLVLVGLLGACGGVPAPAPGSTLSYVAAETRSIRYRMADTARITVEGGAGAAFGVSIRSSALLDAEMAPAPGDSTRVTLRFREFDGTMSTPTAGTVTADEESIDGPLVFRLDRLGRSRVVSRPSLGAQVGQFVDPASLARELFPRFPAGGPGPEGRWSDTLSYGAGEGGARTRATLVRRYLVEGDTTVAGRRLARITYRGTARYDVEGTRMGTEVRQTLEGPVRGELLWDPVARVPVRSRTRKRLSGTMEIPGMAVPATSLRLEGSTVLLAAGG